MDLPPATISSIRYGDASSSGNALLIECDACGLKQHIALPIKADALIIETDWIRNHYCPKPQHG